MVRKSYVPNRGDIIWLEFDPQSGREQAGRRPALVLSPDFYNQPSRLALVCPITSQVKGYPFEVAVSEGKITGVVLADQLKSLDWTERKATLITRVSSTLVVEVIEKIATLLSGT